MNTNEFYKELFEKYALDEEKIRIAALKQAKTPAWKRAAGTYWKSAVGVAAAVAITVGAVAYTAANPPGIDIAVTPGSAMDAHQRLEDAERNYLNPPEVEEEKTAIYVTFRSPMSYADMAVQVSALPDSEDVDITGLYLSDGTSVMGAQETDAFAESGRSENVIIGAKLEASPLRYRDIFDLSCVSVAEMASEKINDETFTPITDTGAFTDDDDPLNNDIDEVQAPDITTTQFAFEAQTTTVLTEAQIVTSLTDAETTEPPSSESDFSESETAEPDITEGSEDTTEPPAETEADETGETGADISAVTEAEIDEPETSAVQTGETEREFTVETEIETDDEPVNVQTDVEEIIDESTEEYIESDGGEEPVSEAETAEETTVSSATEPETSASVTEISASGNQGLMTEIYRLNVENSLETLLINEYAVVLTKNEVYFYVLGGAFGSVNEVRVCEMNSPKIAFSDEDTVIITGCGSSGARNIVTVLDTKNSAVYSSDVSASLGSSEIGGSIYRAEETGKYFFKTVSGSTTYIYEVAIGSSEGVSLRPLFEFDGAVYLGGYENGRLYFAVSRDNVNSSICSFDCTTGDNTVLYELGAGCRIKRSASFRSFIVTGSDGETGETLSYVFDTSTGTPILSAVNADMQITVSRGEIYIKDGNIIYRLSSDGTLSDAHSRRGLSFDSRPTSRFEVAEANPEGVVIAEKNKSLW